MTWPRGNSFHTCGAKMPKCVRASAAVSGPECAGEDVQHAGAELAVLVLLAPDARRQIHQRRERAVGAAPRPDAGELVGIERRVLADEADRRRRVARFLNRRLQTRAERVLLGIVVAPEAAVLQVDRLGEVRGNRQHAVVGDVVQPLDDFGDRAPRAGHFAGLPEQRDLDVLLAPDTGFFTLSVCGSAGRFATRSRSSRNGSRVTSMRSLKSSFDLIADLDDAIGEPVAEAVLVEHRHRDVHVRLELEQPLARIGRPRRCGCPGTRRRSVPRRSSRAPTK